MRKRRRKGRISMTSLIDVIFLLLLFFMLTSTFSRYSTVELVAAAPSGQGASEAPPIFVQLSSDSVRLNTRDASLETLPVLLRADRAHGSDVTLIVALKGSVTSQRLTDFLVAIREVEGVTPVILGAS
ncbi:ExbD/TolR family protein [Celeribacter litoreus]|uniref:ExbD/TolR family protein n=1 Tax=Celeribacter litoreus TaxID=2876714 RepID=UPI001CCED6FC|nr:biopolymer transporter ExbD [Celeribacter litoreus]MCA0043960.1 biopolymer transporter ExbD [Celeribacter litoreus]